MKIVEKRTFAASAKDIWQIIHDPGNMPAWNPKCVTSEKLEKVEVGQKFAVTYEMNGKRSDALGELLNFKENILIHFRYYYEESAKVGVVDEIFELQPRSGSIQLVHTVDFGKSTLPLWVKLLIGFLNRFGKKRGEGSLDGIASLIE